ncbi:MAG: CCA tRNA nucleotidyltransferase [Clostridia bacterium]|nr:CCA tRNA nucleotidyltransferase [Clostridia bacterium]
MQPVLIGKEKLEVVRSHIPQELYLLAELVSLEGARLYAVGGLVRSSLLGLPISDIDICSAVLPERMIALCRERGFTVVPKGIDFGMVEVHIGGESFEHTTFRSDSYAEGGAHRPSEVRFSSSAEEDAFRRDFSVNAMYFDILSGEVLDPTGGLADLEAGLIRTTSPDPRTVLADDGLRIMRLVRFAAELGFDIEPASMAAARELVSNLADISAERIRDELNKVLLADVKYGERSAERVLHGLTLLREVGALGVILPELLEGEGLEQKKEYHRYDVLRHALHAASEAVPALPLRLAALLHDVAKPRVFAETGKMHGHDVVGAELARAILRRLRYDNKTIDRVVFIVRHHMYDLDNAAKDSTLRRTFARWGYERSLDIAEIRIADVHGSGVITGKVAAAERWKRILADMKRENAPFSENELNCSGADIIEWLGIPPGPAVADIKRRMLAHCAVHPRDNTRERLQKLVTDFRPKAES